ncbi:M50 family metallopeptidase [Pseudonocardia bannensis]|uniref:M50 family metallopeptidase n=1 Tax=Pseudonocardia bannensis TaxID=630973 RepID=UPI0028A59E63|nr:M50 family metallopeptidase [Pseudonocardia bannensis]
MQVLSAGSVPPLTDVLRTALETAAGRPAVLAAGVLALVVVVWSVSWRLTRTVVTIAHEGGHALSAIVTGRGLTGIRLHADTSGVTESTGAGRGIGLILTFLGGYPAPPLLGLAGAALVAGDRSRVMLWIAVALLVATLIHIRNLFGALAVLLTGGVVGSVAFWAAPDVRAGFAAALCWFLLFGGLRAVRELQRGRRRGLYRNSDADALARMTGVPGGMWAALFWSVGVAALIAGGWVLLL